MKSRRNIEAGFTLLELLAAMAVLSVMIVMLFAAFSQASRAWLQSENRVETFSQARVALDMMSRELSQAIVSSNITFLGSGTNVAFIAPISTSPGDVVDLEEVVYQWSNGSLTRQVTPASSAAWDFYTQLQIWPGTAASAPVPVADNVVSLSLSYIDTNGVAEAFWNSNQITGGSTWSGIPDYTSLPPLQGAAMTNRAPAAVQIIIETIDSRAATKLQAIAPSGTNAANIIPYNNVLNQAVKTFTTFVAIPNRQP